MTREEANKRVIQACKCTWNEKTCKEIFKVLEQEPCKDKGEISDGYHTFNQLYHQRAILFATIVNQNKDKAWKSFKHSDGQYCFGSNGEWFIVGVDTPQGSYTYHYSKEYWDYFDCKELDCGKEWDGHTEEDVIRLLSLEQEQMRDATPEERESVDAYIKSISKPTGIEFDEKQEQLDFVQPHKSIPVTLTVKSGDAISRKSIKHKLQEHYDFFVNAYSGFNNLSQNDKSRVDEISNCIAMVVNEPSVKPQEKTGHWIMPVQDDGMSDIIYYQVRCSKCGFDLDPQTWDMELHQYDADKYCPKCGAMMVEEQERSEE